MGYIFNSYVKLPGVIYPEMNFRSSQARESTVAFSGWKVEPRVSAAAEKPLRKLPSHKSMKAKQNRLIRRLKLSGFRKLKAFFGGDELGDDDLTISVRFKVIADWLNHLKANINSMPTGRAPQKIRVDQTCEWGLRITTKIPQPCRDVCQLN